MQNDCNFNDVPERVRKRVQTFLTFQRQFGRAKLGISPACSPKTIPNLFDPAAFQRAQQLFQNYSPIILVSQFYGLITVLNFYEGLVPLLVTGNSQTVSKLFTRYTSTIVHIRNWFTYDPFDPESKAYKSLKLVRGYHQQVSNKLNQLDQTKDSDFVWMSQWSMAGGQFSFMGYMTVFPNELGFQCFTKTDFHAMFHFWRTIGYCLRIEDQFNLCSGTDEEVFECCRQWFSEEFLPVIRAGNRKVGIEMGKGICLSTFRLNPLNNFNALLRYGAPFMGFDINNYPIDSLADKMAYCVIWLIYKCLSKSVILNWLMSCLFRPILWQAVIFSRIHECYCKWKYPMSYDTDETCPFEVKFKYRNIVEDELKLF